MFHDPTIVGSWPALAARLDDDAVLARWAEVEPDLAGLTTVADLLAVWFAEFSDPQSGPRRHRCHSGSKRIHPVSARSRRAAVVRGRAAGSSEPAGTRRQPASPPQAAASNMRTI